MPIFTTPPRVLPAPVLELAGDLSPAVAAFQAAYDVEVRGAYPDAPPVTILLKRDAKAWGQTTVASTPETTHYEVMISGENLRRGAEAVAATLLHEAAHARNLEAGIRDFDVNGRHNTRFRDRAREMGLNVEEAGWHGWSLTTLDEPGRIRWAALLARLTEGLALASAPTGTTAPTPVVVPARRTGRRNLIKAVCGCGMSIRVSATVLETAKPKCAKCRRRFLPEDEH